MNCDVCNRMVIKTDALTQVENYKYNPQGTRTVSFAQDAASPRTTLTLANGVTVGLRPPPTTQLLVPETKRIIH